MTTTTTVGAADMDTLEALAKAAEPWSFGSVVEDFKRAVKPTIILELIALARSAQQSSVDKSTIDTPEFHDLLLSVEVASPDRDDGKHMRKRYDECRANLIAHIDAKLPAAAPADNSWKDRLYAAMNAAFDLYCSKERDPDGYPLGLCNDDTQRGVEFAVGWLEAAAKEAPSDERQALRDALADAWAYVKDGGGDTDAIDKLLAAPSIAPWLSSAFHDEAKARMEELAAPSLAAPEAVYQVWNTGSGAWDDVAHGQYDRCNPKYRRTLYASSAGEADCHPACGYIGAECDYPACKVAAPVERESKAEAVDVRSVYEAWELKEAERRKGEPLDADEIAYVLKRCPGASDTYNICPHHWPAFKAGYEAHPAAPSERVTPAQQAAQEGQQDQAVDELTDEQMRECFNGVDFGQMVTADDLFYMIGRAVEKEVQRRCRAQRTTIEESNSEEVRKDAGLLRLVVEKGMQLHFEGRGEDQAVWVDDQMKWADGDRLSATRALIDEVARQRAAMASSPAAAKGEQ